MILQTQNLFHSYGAGATMVKALDDVSISAQKGEFIAIMGPSGCGKSTLMHMLGGMDRPNSGTITIGNTSLTTLSEKELAVFRRRQVGFIFQSFNLIPVLTAQENILLPLLLDAQKPDYGYFEEITRLVGLQDRLGSLPNQLSGGQQQRVAVARALIYKPAIVLADEPTGNLDSKNALEVINLFRQSARTYNQSFVIVTHDKNIASYADRILYMSDGRIVDEEVCAL
ncbi:MAG: ABC transporter ATP-binding protein [Christensenellales bacterium]|jgi:putative ABC transport system ATP-binding protein